MVCLGPSALHQAYATGRFDLAQLGETNSYMPYQSATRILPRACPSTIPMIVAPRLSAGRVVIDKADHHGLQPAGLP